MKDRLIDREIERELTAAHVWPKGHAIRCWHMSRVAALRARATKEDSLD